MKKLALLLALVFGCGCNLYMDLAPAGEPVLDMSMDIVAEPDSELDLTTDPEMSPEVDQAPDVSDMADLLDMVEDADTDADADADADTGVVPLTFEELLSEAQLAYDFRTFEMGVFPGLIPDQVELSPEGQVEWTNSSIRVAGSGALEASSPTDFYSAVIANQSFSVSLWLETSSVELADPLNPNDPNYDVRIITFSTGISERNFTLSQWRDRLRVRIRDIDATTNGTPTNTLEDFFLAEVQHVGLTVMGGRLTVYLNGTQVFTRSVNTFNWDLTFPMTIGNEIGGNRPWAGELFDFRAWDRGLTESEVQLLHDSGIP